MPTVTNNIIKTVLVSTLLVTASNVEARLKYYRYNDNIPMVEMSLNMMVAMGVLEPIPSRLVHDGNPYHRMVTASYSPYSRSAYSYPESSHRYSHYRYNDHLDGPIDPYDRYSSRYYGSRYYGYSPGYPRYRTRGNQWDSPWANRWDNQWDGPWSNNWDSPWDYQRGNQWYSDWDSPWGNQWSNPWNSGWGNQWSNPWNSGWGSPWGNQWSNPWNSGWGSPWGNTWNYQWMNPWSNTTGYQGGWPYTSGYPALPLSPDQLMGNDWSKNNSSQSDDTLRQYRNKEGYQAEKTSWSGHPSGMSYRHNGVKRSNRKLNGLWIGDNGEMLGIRGNRFLWYDDDSQYAKGELVKSPTMMKARIDGANSVVHYHYKLQGNELVIISRNGNMRTFNRMPLIQPQNASTRSHAAYSSYKPESDNAYVLYSMYGTGQQYEKAISPRHPSDRLASRYDTNRRSAPVAPHKYYSSHRFGKSNLRGSRTVNGFRGDNASTSAPTHSDSLVTRYAPEAVFDSAAVISKAAYTRDATRKRQTETFDSADQADTIPLYKQYQPAAGKLDAADSTDSVVTADVVTEQESTSWNSFPAGADMDDPNTYLYSYLKDNASVSTSANQDGSDSTAGSTAADKNDRSNIWKPNNMFPARRSNTGRWSLSDLASNSEMSKHGRLNAGSRD
jgi:hypothetical protein